MVYILLLCSYILIVYILSTAHTIYIYYTYTGVQTPGAGLEGRDIEGRHALVAEMGMYCYIVCTSLCVYCVVLYTMSYCCILYS